MKAYKLAFFVFLVTLDVVPSLLLLLVLPDCDVSFESKDMMSLYVESNFHASSIALLTQ
jgi:hypothetical protein